MLCDRDVAVLHVGIGRVGSEFQKFGRAIPITPRPRPITQFLPRSIVRHQLLTRTNTLACRLTLSIMTNLGHSYTGSVPVYPQVLRRGVYPTRTIGGSRGDGLSAYLATTCTRVPLAAGVELSLSVSLALQLFKPVLGIDFIQGRNQRAVRSQCTVCCDGSDPIADRSGPEGFPWCEPVRLVCHRGATSRHKICTTTLESFYDFGTCEWLGPPTWYWATSGRKC